MKDSSGDFANTSSFVHAYAKDGFEVYCGDDGALNESAGDRRGRLHHRVRPMSAVR